MFATEREYSSQDRSKAGGIIPIRQDLPTSPPLDTLSSHIKISDLNDKSDNHEKRISDLEQALYSIAGIGVTNIDIFHSSSARISSQIESMGRSNRLNNYYNTNPAIEINEKTTGSARMVGDKEVDPMSEYVSKDAFEAHMRRIDDNVTSIKETFIDRISAMEERMSHKTSSMENELKSYTTELRTRDEERKRELDRLYEMVKSNTEVTQAENKQTRWTMLGLTFTVLAAILSAMVPLGYQFFLNK